MPMYIVTRRFKAGHSEDVYARFEAQGRMLPSGLRFIDSWLAASDDVCWQLMETENPETFDKWTACWDDLVSFEVRELKDKPIGSMT